ncbi:MAG: hypothetical protein OXU51_07360 [Candidatus Poribacteria bacterium]|nr:hypothetical protein [Candidatus Poribacteria bacterium]
MLKKIQAVFVFLFVVVGAGFPRPTLMGNETAKTYFPGAFGSYWVYQDPAGKILGTETVETQAGTFEDCLKIEYRTATTMEVSPLEQHSTNDPPGESVTILWLAPNVGIVKFHQEAEDILLKTIPAPEFQSSTAVKTFELTKYEIKSEESGNNESD